MEAEGPGVGKLEEKTSPAIYLLDIVTSETHQSLELPRLKWQSWDHGMYWAQLMKWGLCVEWGVSGSQDSVNGVREGAGLWALPQPVSGRVSEKALALRAFTPRQIESKAGPGFEEGRCGVRLGKGFLL